MIGINHGWMKRTHCRGGLFGRLRVFRGARQDHEPSGACDGASAWLEELVDALEIGAVGAIIVAGILLLGLRAVGQWPAAVARFTLPGYAAGLVVAGLAFGIWQSWSWAEVAAEVEALAGGLLAMGFRRGDRLAIIGDNRPRLYWAIAATQAIFRQNIKSNADKGTQALLAELESQVSAALKP